jgi:serine protease Do
MQLKRTTAAISAAVLLGCGAAAGWVVPGAFHMQNALAAEPALAQPTAPIPLASAPNYRAIVADNRAAVVGITIEGVQHTQFSNPFQGGANPFKGTPFGDDPFFKFFQQIPGQQQSVPIHALGSGFIVRADGVILTNAHVVRDATHVTVTLADHHEYRAKVLGIDTATDVAVLKIDANNLPVVHLGNANQLEVGDYVLAIGAPYGLEESATAGIVSAKGRSLPDNSYVPFIQTDVAVNPGNSGGPLFDEHGYVIGINSQIYSNTGGFEGVSFAIPINVAVHDEQQILKTGKVEHALLGVTVQPVNAALAGSFKLASPQGALVSKVEPNSAASRAGIEPGDVILKFDGQPVSDSGSLSALVGMSEPGKSVALDVWRGGKPLTLNATLGSAGGAETLASAGQNAHERLGLSVRPLSPQERQQDGVPAGLLVEGASGPAADAGIQPGDVVLSADGKPVGSVEQLRSIVAQHKNVVALLVQRGDSRIFVPVQLG